PEAAWVAAERAYRSGPVGDLRKAAERFLAEPEYQQRCFAGLEVEGTEDVLRGVRELLLDLEAGGAGGVGKSHSTG
ncbi:MAG: hypothetical protein ABI134_31610, partial [Byssovorax sp.]